ncbi:MAG: RNase adapter RapZ [Clostridiales bacterium]|nr:RNase adapter RapZ [Clostridiales bacterium]
MQVVIITGMSGAGRSRAANWFEDQGYYCVDNMPPVLIYNFLDIASMEPGRIEKVAFVTDLRTGNFFNKLSQVIDELAEADNIELTVLYMEASASEIVKRYNEVRRNHPLTGQVASKDVVEKERIKLEPIRNKSDYILDTTAMKVAEMYAELDALILEGRGATNFTINLSSFGFKYGLPSEADMIFDVRFLPNPYYLASLKKLTGKNKKVIDYIFKNELAGRFVDSVHILLSSLISGYINEGKYHLNISIGCTGGHHRSVAITDALARKFKKDGIRVHVRHRDIELQAKRK